MTVSDYQVVIGLEVHCQLLTRTKMFSPCAYEPGAGAGSLDIEPNALTDPYTWGMPGTLPVPNRAAVDCALRLALALGCAIERTSRWARKHYFYPDLPKGYQITQSDRPYALGGGVEIPVPSDDDPLATRTIRLERIHMEEDAGKNTHVGGEAVSLVDLSRAGAALVEIVSRPDLRSATEAADYVRELRTVVRYLGICDANMEQGTLRCDANVSLNRPGAPLGTRCEIKNLNSFKFLEAAILAEIRRQADLLDRGQTVVQSTMSYDPGRDRTSIMRTKEDAADYRYFPEPDLPTLTIDEAWIADARARLPELPWARRRRLVDELGLSAYDAGVLSAEIELGDYFARCLGALPPGSAKTACNWITGDLLKLVRGHDHAIATCPVTPEALAELIALVEADTISGRAGKQVLEACYDAGRDGPTPTALVEQLGLRQVSDADAIAALVGEVVDAHPEQLAQLLAGKTKVRGFFVGQVMRASKGQANPKRVNEALDALLAERRQRGDA